MPIKFTKPDQPNIDIGNVSNIETVEYVGDINFNYDSFKRIRVSEPHTVFSNKQLYANEELFFSYNATGTGTRTYNQAYSLTELAVNSGVGTAIRRTRRKFNYESGKTLQINLTGAMYEGDPSVKTYMGYMNDTDGFYMMRQGNDFYIGFRQYGADTLIPRAQWLDPLDGTGNSGINLNLGNAILMYISMQWLGVGKTEIGFYTDDGPITVAEISGNQYTYPYVGSPNLHIQWNIEATASLATRVRMNAICCSVQIEGGSQNAGAFLSAATPTVKIVGTTFVPLISLRLNPTNARYFTSSVLIEDIEFIVTNNQEIQWGITANQTITTPVWNSLNYSSVQYDTASTVLTFLGTEAIFKQGFVSSNSVEKILVASYLALGVDTQDIPDVVTIYARSISGVASNVFCAVNWRELI